MHIHFLSRLAPGPEACSAAALARLARALRDAGSTIEDDVAPRPQGDVTSAAEELARTLRDRWTEHRPDVVHAHGSVAGLAAVAASAGRVPVVVTMDESCEEPAVEVEIARGADAILVRSSAERDGWAAHNIPADRVHLVPIAVAAQEQVPVAATHPPLVVTDARGQMLERIVLSMRSWPADVGLVVIGPLTATEEAAARRLSRAPVERIQVVARDRTPWERVCLVLAGPGGARNAGLVVEGASHGVPAIAADVGAHSDVVVDGATGVLVPLGAGPHVIGQAVAQLLADPLRLRGYGLAAHLRARATHDPELAAGRCLAAYRAAIARHCPGTDESEAVPADDIDDSPGHVLGCADGLPGRWQELVLEHLPVARRLAQRYAGRGQSVDDLVQVANLGLVKAAQRFEPDQGTPFVAYAVPTMLGELRRYFRDNAWAIHVPRSLQETALRVRHAGDRLRQTLGHEVDASEIAHDLGLGVDAVLEARNASGVAFACRSLDAALLDDGESRLSEILGSDDASLEQIEARESLRLAFGRLPAREREILVLRFFGELTQAEIADQLGISQMHVSRLLARTLRTLREHVVDDAPLPGGWTAATSA